jgi:hypothetical protein
MARESAISRLLHLLHLRLTKICREELLDLVERLQHVKDSRMRRKVFLDEISRAPGAVSVELLYWLGNLARTRHTGAQNLFLDLLDEESVKAALSPGKIDEIWRLGRLKGYREMLELFFYTTGIDNRLEERPGLPPDIRDIPLGRRKSMARAGEIRTLERLLKDNDENVIKNLLVNPRLTEREVVNLVARRPNSAAVLSQVARDRRWISRYSVRKALIYNPYTPVNISVPLVRYLIRPDLVELSRHSAVNDILKQAARKLLEEGLPAPDPRQ